METSVDSQVSYSRTKKQVDIRFQTNVSDVKSQRPRRQWCLNVIIVYHIFLTGVNAFLLYKVLTLRPSTSATSREKLTSSNHIPLGGEQDDVDLPMMIRNSSQETETLKGYLGALQSQVNSLCEEEGQLGRLRADLSLVNTSTYILEDKLAAISLRPGTPGPPGLKGDRGIPDEFPDTPQRPETPESTSLTATSSSHPGEAGMQGLAGTKGEKGQKGDNGVGSAGPPGPQGPKGETGPQGPPGSSGSHGSTGPMGPPGPSGPRGTVGPPGVPGSQGPGVKGDTGVPGVQGPPGRDGAKGAKGDTGMQGPQGTTGATGTKGQRGDTGLPGPAGPPGPRGPASSSSSTGPRGPPGPPGPKGDRGPLGRWDLQLSGFLATFRTRGRIELQYDGVWGTVCDDDFDILDATVICRMLGLSTATEVYTHGSGSGTIWLDNLQCTGSEWSIFECPHNGMGVNNCDHSEDVGVSCA